MEIFQNIYSAFEAFLNELPPLLQLIVGVLIALGVFKLLSWVVDAVQKSQGGK